MFGWKVHISLSLSSCIRSSFSRDCSCRRLNSIKRFSVTDVSFDLLPFLFASTSLLKSRSVLALLCFLAPTLSGLLNSTFVLNS